MISLKHFCFKADLYKTFSTGTILGLQIPVTAQLKKLVSVELFEYYLSFSFKLLSGTNIFLSQVALTEKWADINKNKGIGFYSMHPGWAETPGVAQSLPSFSKAYGTFHLSHYI